MSDKENTVPVYVDFLPSHAGHPAGRETVVALHRQWLESNLDAIITRQAKLPILMVHNTSESVRLIVDLLLEARTLFCFEVDPKNWTTGEVR